MEAAERNYEFDLSTLDPKTIGRQTAKIRDCLKYLAQGEPKTKACLWSGVKYKTFHNWIKAHEDFRRAVKEAQKMSVENMGGIAYCCARMALTDPRYQRSLFFFMKCKAGWSEQPWKNEKKGKGGIDWEAVDEERIAEEEALEEMSDEEMDLLSAALYLAENDLTLEEALARESTESKSVPFVPSTVNDAAPNSSIVIRKSSIDRTVPSVPSAPERAQHAAPLPTPETQDKTVPSVPFTGDDPAPSQSSLVTHQSSLDETVPSVPFGNSTATPSPIRNPKSATRNLLVPDPKRHQKLNWRAANRNRNKSKKR